MAKQSIFDAWKALEECNNVLRQGQKPSEGYNIENAPEEFNRLSQQEASFLKKEQEVLGATQSAKSELKNQINALKDAYEATDSEAGKKQQQAVRNYSEFLTTQADKLLRIYFVEATNTLIVGSALSVAEACDRSGYNPWFVKFIEDVRKTDVSTHITNPNSHPYETYGTVYYEFSKRPDNIADLEKLGQQILDSVAEYKLHDVHKGLDAIKEGRKILFELPQNGVTADAVVAGESIGKTA